MVDRTVVGLVSSYNGSLLHIVGLFSSYNGSLLHMVERTVDLNLPPPALQGRSQVNCRLLRSANASLYPRRAPRASGCVALDEAPEHKAPCASASLYTHTHTHIHTHTHTYTHSLTHSLTHSPPPFVCVCARACACVCVCVSLSAAPLLPPTAPVDPAALRSIQQQRRRSQGPH